MTSTPDRARLERDPAALSRLGHVGLTLLILWWASALSEVDLELIFALTSWRDVGSFLATFWPPSLEPSFIDALLKAVLETLAIATAGMALALLIAAPLAYAASQAAREQRSRSVLSRGVMVILRGVPEIVWALLFVRIFGLGPTAGVIALALTYGGMLAKVFSEALESVDPTPGLALRRLGASRMTALLFGVFPQARDELLSYTVYRWECAVRASVVMGFVGAGGLGQLMDQAMKMLNGPEAASIFMVFVVLVFAADWFSDRLRQPRWAPSYRQSLRSSIMWAVLWVVLIVLSWRYLAVDVSGLWHLESLQSIGQFILAFSQPNLSPEFLDKVGQGALETLAISLSGTALAVFFALLGLFLVPRPFAGSLFNALRSVPELVWATLTVLIVGLGPFAGVLALTLHTGGVLGRLYGQALDNAPVVGERALTHLGAAPVPAFLYGKLLYALPQLIAYTLYRWEMNIRMAAVLGFVGAGGLGQALHFSLSLFHYAESSTLVLAMLLLSVFVDQSSRRLRVRL